MKPKDMRTAIEIMDMTGKGSNYLRDDVHYTLYVFMGIVVKLCKLMEKGIDSAVEDVKAQYPVWMHRIRVSFVSFLSGLGLVSGFFPTQIGWPLLRTAGWIWVVLTIFLIMATQLLSAKNNWAYLQNLKKSRRGILRYRVGLRNCILKNQCKAQKKTILHKPYNAFLLAWVMAFGMPAEIIGNVLLSHVLTFFLALCWPLRPLIKPS